MIHIEVTQLEHLVSIQALLNHEILNHTAHFATEPWGLDDLRGEYERTRNRFPWLSALDGDRVVAFARAAPWKSRQAYQWTVEATVYVERSRVGQGVGRALMEALCAILERQGYALIISGMALPNPAGEALLERLGFRAVGVFADVGFKHGEWRSVGYWELRLRPPSQPPAELRTVDEVVAEIG